MIRKRAQVLCILLALTAAGRAAFAYKNGEWQQTNIVGLNFRLAF